ncbi:hypothetical protein ACFPTO_20005 [Paraburkholderia denitrificans]|uniref:Uncharacterized protein n=1 Tax=Paraburkholderia denitrificans TaxID=694025 RepID=A0ABW0JD21_9BURK
MDSVGERSFFMAADVALKLAIENMVNKNKFINLTGFLVEFSITRIQKCRLLLNSLWIVDESIMKEKRRALTSCGNSSRCRRQNGCDNG